MNDSPPPAARAGLLLVGHGTRDPLGQREFFLTADHLRAICPGQRIEPCFLELCPPTIADGVATLFAGGVRSLGVMPLLLFAAGHAKRDIPSEVAEAAAGHEGLRVLRALTALGCHEAILWLSELRYREALSGRLPVPSEETALVLVGRGSGDAEATVEMHRFAALRRLRTPVGCLEVGFLAVANPPLGEALRQAAVSGCRRVVVQPHLLFHGELVDEVRRTVRTLASASAIEWIVTAPLGPGRPLARAVADRAGWLWPRAPRCDRAISAEYAKNSF